MARLALAERNQVDAITRESYTLWGGGLTYEDYRGLWDEVGRCTWARKHARYYVWEDVDGRVLSSMKVYRPRLQVMGAEGRCSVFGAIFTPRSRRRHGHAGNMMRAALADLRRRGDIAAMLFSDIGTSYYSAFGFQALPSVEHVGRLPAPRADSAPEIVLRPAREDDLLDLLDAHDAVSRRRSIRIVRDVEHWEFLWRRSRSFFSRVTDRSVRQRWRVATHAGAFVGYVITVEGRGEWNVREVGAADGSVDAMIEIFRAAAAEAYAAGLRRVYGWLPGELAAGLERWPIRGRVRKRALPMLRPDHPIVDLARLRGAGYIPFQDQF